MNEQQKPSFGPYLTFRANTRRIHEFVSITSLSHGIAQQLLFRHPKRTLPRITLPPTKRDQLTYSPADVTISDVEEICRWVTVEELAELTGESATELRLAAEVGRLGPVEQHPDSKELLVVWPPSQRDTERSKLPRPGLKTFRVTQIVKAKGPVHLDTEDRANFEQVQQQFLRMAHSVGKPAEVGQRAEEMLFRAGFLLYWTAFEVCIKSTVHELYRRHPHVIATGKKARTEVLNYEEVLSLSHRFTDVEALRSAMVERAIEQASSNDQSVHGLINLLKSEFRFTDDPYTTWCVFHGTRTTIGYNDLMMFKDTRNALLHDGGQPRAEFFQKYSSVTNRNGEIVVDADLFTKASLTLDAIAHSIAQSINDGEYRV